MRTWTPLSQTTTAQVFISRDANAHSLDVCVGVVVHLQGLAGSTYNTLTAYDTKRNTRLPLFLEHQRQTSHRPGNPSPSRIQNQSLIAQLTGGSKECIPKQLRHRTPLGHQSCWRRGWECDGVYCLGRVLLDFLHLRLLTVRVFSRGVEQLNLTNLVPSTQIPAAVPQTVQIIDFAQYVYSTFRCTPSGMRVLNGILYIGCASKNPPIHILSFIILFTHLIFYTGGLPYAVLRFSVAGNSNLPLFFSTSVNITFHVFFATNRHLLGWSEAGSYGLRVYLRRVGIWTGGPPVCPLRWFLFQSCL